MDHSRLNFHRKLSPINSVLYTSQVFLLFSPNSSQQLLMYHLLSTQMTPREKSKNFFPLRRLRNQTISISFLHSYSCTKNSYVSSPPIYLLEFINLGYISNKNFRREYSVILVCQLLPSKYIALNYKPSNLYSVS